MSQNEKEFVNKIKTVASESARRFSTSKYFKLRAKYYGSSNNIVKAFYAFKIKRIEGLQGGYVGLPSAELFAGPPILPHGLLSVFVDEKAKIGKGCIIHEQVVIGRSKGKSPQIGDGCFFGAGAKLIGGIKVGNNCRFGAGVVVVDDVPDNTTVVCQKPRYLTKDENYKLTKELQNEGREDESGDEKTNL